MRLLVVGGNGLLGSTVVAAGLERDWTVESTYHTDPVALPVEQSRLDITDDEQVRARLDAADPDLVVNCAAMTAVDACESDPERARAVNAEAPGVLAGCAARLDARFVHVSTDYVFDGTARSPYAETADPNPLQCYGRTKLDGERAAIAATSETLVPRLSFVYGVHAGEQTLAGFPAWVADRLASGESTPLFTDQYVTPTRAGFAADCILELAAAGVDGIVNVACRDCVTPYELGRLVARTRGDDERLIERSTMDRVDRPAARPRYSCLATDRLSSTLAREVPPLDAELATVL